METGRGLAGLYWQLSYDILKQKPAKGETVAGGRPAGSRLWPLTIFRDALVQAYANQPDLPRRLSPPAAPAAAPTGRCVRVPLPGDTPGYRDYLAWLDPAPGAARDAGPTRSWGRPSPAWRTARSSPPSAN